MQSADWPMHGQPVWNLLNSATSGPPVGPKSARKILASTSSMAWCLQATQAISWSSECSMKVQAPFFSPVLLAVVSNISPRIYWRMPHSLRVVKQASAHCLPVPRPIFGMTNSISSLPPVTSSVILSLFALSNVRKQLSSPLKERIKLWINSCSTVACFSRLLQRERLMELLNSVTLLMSWPSAFVTVPMTCGSSVWYV